MTEWAPRNGVTLRSTLALYLDSLLLVMVLLLLSPKLTGLPAHEALGVLLVLPILLPPLDCTSVDCPFHQAVLGLRAGVRA
jgi:hypothetical protein